MSNDRDQKLVNLLDIAQWKLTPYQILVIGFACLILVGTLLLMTPLASATGKPLTFIDALFTAASAVCVTGLVVVDTGTFFSLFGQMVILFLIQVGGLGFMTMTTLMALLLGKRIQLRERLIIQEALNQLSIAGVVRLTQYIVMMTLGLEFIGGTLLAIRWYFDFGVKGVYFGYWHAVSAFCNAGFDLIGEYRSMTGYVDDLAVNGVISALFILGGLGFTVIIEVWNNCSYDRLSLHTKIVLVTSAVLTAAGTAVIFILEFNNPETIGQLTLPAKMLASYFQAVTPRTAGYNTLDISKLENATLFFIIFLMFIGASPASTGGGVKTSTVGVVMASIWALISGKNNAEIYERRIPPMIVYKAFSVVIIAAFLVILMTMILNITEQAPFLNILFEVVSAFGTVGLSTGITPTLTTAGKIVIIIMMFTGRVGPVTLALAIALKRRKGVIQYPEGKVIIG